MPNPDGTITAAERRALRAAVAAKQAEAQRLVDERRAASELTAQSVINGAVALEESQREILMNEQGTPPQQMSKTEREVEAFAAGFESVKAHEESLK
jgi:alkylhydroperoxidase family enzyme